MGKAVRIQRVITGAVMLLGAVAIMSGGADAMNLIVAILGITFVLSGIKDIIRFFTMTRHMVGGRLILYRGVIILDLGIFTLSLSTATRFYTAVYLAALCIFAGVIDVFRGFESRRIGNTNWKILIIEGIVKTILGLLCIIYINNGDVLALVYAITLGYSAITRIASAFRKTAVIYIQ